MEPETFGQDFALLISFWLLLVVGGFSLFCFFSIRNSVLVSPAFSWKILWMNGELIGLGYQRSQ